MISIICTLDGSPSATAKALAETENFAHHCGLAQKQLLHLRLLAEELIGMTEGVLDVEEGEFWIEREGTLYRLCLTAYAEAGKTARKLLLGASSTGENEFFKGVTGKIRQALEWMFRCRANAVAVPAGGIGMGMLPMPEDVEWSLDCYRRNLKMEEAVDWDELEKSVLTKLADDILVGVREDETSITILKSFS